MNVVQRDKKYFDSLTSASTVKMNTACFIAVKRMKE